MSDVNRCADPCRGSLVPSPLGWRFCVKCGARYHPCAPSAPEAAPAGPEEQIAALAGRVKLLEDDARDRATIVVDLERRMTILEGGKVE